LRNASAAPSVKEEIDTPFLTVLLA